VISCWRTRWSVFSCRRRRRTELSFFASSHATAGQARLHRAQLGRSPGTRSRDDRCLPLDDCSRERSTHQSHALSLRHSAVLFTLQVITTCHPLTTSLRFVRLTVRPSVLSSVSSWHVTRKYSIKKMQPSCAVNFSGDCKNRLVQFPGRTLRKTKNLVVVFYGIGQTIIFSCCGLFFLLLLFSSPNHSAFHPFGVDK